MSHNDVLKELRDRHELLLPRLASADHLVEELSTNFKRALECEEPEEQERRRRSWDEAVRESVALREELTRLSMAIMTEEQRRRVAAAAAKQEGQQ
jgi:hypothetical protein